ncbi:RNA polymerase sigma factor [Pseudobacter ginsenosidimutans]|uniref:RNA polymerase sigma-70 factor (ECF subfamily) n=1 Tax=Pseudobacter ginsenosidimutans TaxID=661488 RepID=A0A4V2F1S3_9BACT|nr:sigma-70 family RNA polymerase sigma factor [Pseudobacter ginsenosidimutans]QEC43403.1 sigma-70 family RNA polymerase sigma factor [Pseudobacter ginsenosidimutans]RZS74776.1 RNA polymerase sigma-70 factor (ECF subfamily) [Pseudobacter ginsenosidimutans]
MENNTSYNDQDLIRFFREEDEQAIRQVYMTHYKPLVFFCNEIVKDKLQAEDITQEVFVKVWKNRQKFQSIAELRAYLYVSAKNAALNILDHIEVRDKYKKEMARLENDEPAYIESRMLFSELMVSVYEEIGKLPPMYAEVLKLLYLEEVPPAQVASQLQLTPENLRIRKFRAIGMLKSALIKKGFSTTTLIFYYFLVTKG